MMKFHLVLFCVFFFGDYNLVRTHELSEIPPEEVPYHAVVQCKMVCGGILISENYVITTAYCVQGSSSATVYLGFRGYPYYLAHHSEPDTQIIETAHIFIHEDFTRVKDNYLNNIALAKLETPAILTNKVQLGKILCKEEAKLLEGRNADISGWSVSSDKNLQQGVIKIRDQDTCDYLYGGQFLRSQEFCVKWLTETRLNLLGNAVSVGNKIIGFQTNCPKCLPTGPSCTRNDMVLNFMNYLDWISYTINIPIEEFTSGCEKTCCDNDLSKIKDLVYKINEETSSSNKFDIDITTINGKIESILAQLQIIKNEQNNFAITLNEQIGDVKTEITNNRARTDKSLLDLEEELNGARTEISNGFSAQKDLSGLEARFNDLRANVENRIDEELKKIKAQIEDLSKKIQNCEIEENQHYLALKQEISFINGQLSGIIDRDLKYSHELDAQFDYINVTIKEISLTQHHLDTELEDINNDLKVHIIKAKGVFADLQERLDEIAKHLESTTLKHGIRCDQIEKTLGEQRHDLDNHLVKEFEENHLLWADIKTMKATITKIENYVYESPLSN